MDPRALALTNSMINGFLKENPDAEIIVSRFSEEEMEPYLEDIRLECGKPDFQAKEMYRVTIEDPDSDFHSIVWIDAQENMIECAIKYDTETQISNPPGPGCWSHSSIDCFKGHVYWFDSCREVEEQKEFCEHGCYDGVCKPVAGMNCFEMNGYCVPIKPGAKIVTETGEIACAEGYKKSDYWCPEGQMCCTPDEGYFCGWSTMGACEQDGDCVLDGCSGEVCRSSTDEPVDTTCEYKECKDAVKYEKTCGCVRNKCVWKEIEKCWESDAGKNYYEKGNAEFGNQRTEDYCDDNFTLIERFCTETQEISSIQHRCEYGCFEGACIKEEP